jgi:hypothetical protein
MVQERRWFILYAHPRPGSVAYVQLVRYWKAVTQALHLGQVRRCEATQYPFHATLSPWLHLTESEAKCLFHRAQQSFAPLFASTLLPIKLFNCRGIVPDAAAGRLSVKLHAPHVQACVRLLFPEHMHQVQNDDVPLTLASSVHAAEEFGQFESLAQKLITLDAWVPEEWCVAMWSTPTREEPTQLRHAGMVAQLVRDRGDEDACAMMPSVVARKQVRFSSCNWQDGHTRIAKLQDAQLNLKDPQYWHKFLSSATNNTHPSGHDNSAVE